MSEPSNKPGVGGRAVRREFLLHLRSALGVVWPILFGLLMLMAALGSAVALLEGGVDLFIVETMFDLLGVKAAIRLPGLQAEGAPGVGDGRVCFAGGEGARQGRVDGGKGPEVDQQSRTGLPALGGLQRAHQAVGIPGHHHVIGDQRPTRRQLRQQLQVRDALTVRRSLAPGLDGKRPAQRQGVGDPLRTNGL